MTKHIRVNELEGHEVPLGPVCLAVMQEEIAGLRNYLGDSGWFQVMGRGWQHNVVEIGHKNTCVASFELEQMPGCCAIGTTSYLMGDEKMVPFKTLYALQEKIAKAAKWGILIATLTDGQDDKIRAVRALGWRLGYQNFLNPKTGNGINVLVKDLTLER